MSQKNTEEDVVPKKKSKLVLILIILILLLLLGAGAATFWWFQLRAPTDTAMVDNQQGQTSSENVAATSNTTATQNSQANTGDSVNSDANSQGTQTNAPQNTAKNITSIPTVTVNLSDTDPIRYLRVGMDVELSATEAVEQVKAENAKIRDSIIILLSSKNYQELSSARGKLEVKNEVASRINQILGSPRVVRIYFTEFVIQ